MTRNRRGPMNWLQRGLSGAWPAAGDGGRETVGGSIALCLYIYNSSVYASESKACPPGCNIIPLGGKIDARRYLYIYIYGPHCGVYTPKGDDGGRRTFASLMLYCCCCCSILRHTNERTNIAAQWRTREHLYPLLYTDALLWLALFLSLSLYLCFWLCPLSSSNK